jgi:hypothetical protein
MRFNFSFPSRCGSSRRKASHGCPANPGVSIALPSRHGARQPCSRAGLILALPLSSSCASRGSCFALFSSSKAHPTLCTSKRQMGVNPRPNPLAQLRSQSTPFSAVGKHADSYSLPPPGPPLRSVRSSLQIVNITLFLFQSFVGFKFLFQNFVDFIFRNASLTRTFSLVHTLSRQLDGE